MTGLVWLDGALRDRGRAPAVSVFDHGLTVGDGVFETVKAVDGTRRSRSPAICDRLARSAGGLGLPDPGPRRGPRRACAAVLDANPVPRWRGCGSRTPAGSPRSAPTAATRPPRSSSPSRRDRRGPSATPRPWSPCPGSATSAARSPGSRPPRTPRTSSPLARAHASTAPSEALFANTARRALRGHRLQRLRRRRRHGAHPAARHRLPGRASPASSSWSGRTPRRPSLPYDVLDRADEVFLTSSTRDVHPVSAVDGADRSAPGPHTRRVAAEFARRSSEEVDP